MAAERKSQYLSELAKEESQYKRLAHVFGSAEGLEVLEWVLTDLCGYWREHLEDERTIGRFELGRALFNKVCMADIEICHTLLDRRRKAAESVRIEERRRIESITE